MKIEGIRLRNFKAFRDIELTDLPRMCVFVGANGSGKTTLFSVFNFLQDALADNVHVALTKLGAAAVSKKSVAAEPTAPSRSS